MKTSLVSLHIYCTVVLLCSCGAGREVSRQRGGASDRHEPFYGSKPVTSLKPLALDGFQPGSTYKDPYTGQIYTADEAGQIVVP